MFLVNLSANVRYLCNFYRLSYERASERCSISPRYFGSIARGETAPTVHTLEKLCNGFDLTPNDLLITSAVQRELVYRRPMPVTQVRCYRYAAGLTGFPLCPRCKMAMEREYQNFCDRCGQRLDWGKYGQATLILPNE